MRELDPTLCCTLTPNSRGVPHFQCSRKHKVERDGRKYCMQHDPEFVAAKAKAKQEKLDREWEHGNWRTERQNLKDAIAEAAIDRHLGNTNTLTRAVETYRKHLKKEPSK